MVEPVPGNYLEYYVAVAESVKNASEPPSGGEEARCVMRILEAAIKSDETGCRFELVWK